jgi:exodeoxyribonuclease-5
MVASVDDDVTVKSVTQGTVKHLETGAVVPVWSLAVEGDANLTLKIPVDDSEVQAILSNLAEFAKREKGYSRKAAWAQFWRFKRMFHKVRYGAAITAHRSQGSTYENVFVDQMDILANSDKRTAFKCLYVAFTRPTTRVFTY